MFGKKKKKYIKDLSGQSFKTPSIEESSSRQKNSTSHKPLNYRLKNDVDLRKRFNLDKLLKEDSLLIQIEKSIFLDEKAPDSVYEELSKGTFLKSATLPLHIIAGFLTLWFINIVWSAESLKVNSTAYIFIVLIPVIIGFPIIFISTFAIWRNYFKPIARIILRVILRYWFLILVALHLILIKNILGIF